MCIRGKRDFKNAFGTIFSNEKWYNSRVITAEYLRLGGQRDFEHLLTKKENSGGDRDRSVYVCREGLGTKRSVMCFTW